MILVVYQQLMYLCPEVLHGLRSPGHTKIDSKKRLGVGFIGNFVDWLTKKDMRWWFADPPGLRENRIRFLWTYCIAISLQGSGKRSSTVTPINVCMAFSSSSSDRMRALSILQRYLAGCEFIESLGMSLMWMWYVRCHGGQGLGSLWYKLYSFHEQKARGKDCRINRTVGGIFVRHSVVWVHIHIWWIRNKTLEKDEWEYLKPWKLGWVTVFSSFQKHQMWRVGQSRLCPFHRSHITARIALQYAECSRHRQSHHFKSVTDLCEISVSYG